ncbi:MAG TPA: Nramp family divalent metal transporter [Planctomycetota bacterium]|nr:Nramp family divalent metal transporter [Planctomycetota bacterium]
MKALRWLTRIGPAFVIAAVVLGPGSVTTMSKMGAQHGYAMLWLPLLAGVLMAGFVMLFMRFGISTNKSFLQHCADTWGRGFAALAGIAMFYIATAFQFGNNIGVSTALSSLLTPSGEARAAVPEWVWPLVFNALALAFLFAFRRIYTILEKSMTVLVAVMLIAFLTNLFFARPSLGGIARGLVPSVPEGLDVLVAAGLVATTFSIVGAIFQSYMVRARGWTQANCAEGVTDSFSGIGMLTLISMVIMMTSAAVLRPRNVQIRDAADMAGQLEALLGAGAKLVFCIGFGAAAFSSFLVNAMIGGTLLSDGLGWSDDINSRPARLCSAASLIIGGAVAVLIQGAGILTPADALVAGQAGTLLAIPLAILATLVVLFHPGRSGARPLGLVAKAFVLIGVAVLIVNAVGSYIGFIAKLSGK